MEKLKESRPYGTVHGVSSHRYEQDGKIFDVNKRRIASVRELKKEAETKRKALIQDQKDAKAAIKRAEERESLVTALTESQELLGKLNDDEAPAGDIFDAEKSVQDAQKALDEFDSE